MKELNFNTLNILEIIEYAYFAGPMPTFYYDDGDQMRKNRRIREEIVDRVQIGIVEMKLLEKHIIDKTFRIHYKRSKIR